MVENSTTVVTPPFEATAFAPSEATTTTVDYVSPWKYATSASNNTLTIPHTLGKVPLVVTAQFTADQNTVYPLSWSWANNYSGNPVTISADASNVYIEIFSGTPLHGVWKATTGAWTTWSTGFFRVAVSA